MKNLKMITLLSVLNVLAWGHVATAQANQRVLCSTFDGTHFVHHGSVCPAGSYFVRYVI